MRLTEPRNLEMIGDRLDRPLVRLRTTISTSSRSGISARASAGRNALIGVAQDAF